jgi:hypothetical protein
VWRNDKQKPDAGDWEKAGKAIRARSQIIQQILFTINNEELIKSWENMQHALAYAEKTVKKKTEELRNTFNDLVGERLGVWQTRRLNGPEIPRSYCEIEKGEEKMIEISFPSEWQRVQGDTIIALRDHEAVKVRFSGSRMCHPVAAEDTSFRVKIRIMEFCTEPQKIIFVGKRDVIMEVIVTVFDAMVKLSKNNLTKLRKALQMNEESDSPYYSDSDTEMREAPTVAPTAAKAVASMDATSHTATTNTPTHTTITKTTASMDAPSHTTTTKTTASMDAPTTTTRTTAPNPPTSKITSAITTEVTEKDTLRYNTRTVQTSRCKVTLRPVVVARQEIKRDPRMEGEMDWRTHGNPHLREYMEGKSEKVLQEEFGMPNFVLARAHNEVVKAHRFLKDRTDPTTYSNKPGYNARRPEAAYLDAFYFGTWIALCNKLMKPEAAADSKFNSLFHVRVFPKSSTTIVQELLTSVVNAAKQHMGDVPYGKQKFYKMLCGPEFLDRQYKFFPEVLAPERGPEWQGIAEQFEKLAIGALNFCSIHVPDKVRAFTVLTKYRAGQGVGLHTDSDYDSTDFPFIVSISITGRAQFNLLSGEGEKLQYDLNRALKDGDIIIFQAGTWHEALECTEGRIVATVRFTDPENINCFSALPDPPKNKPTWQVEARRTIERQTAERMKATRAEKLQKREPAAPRRGTVGYDGQPQPLQTPTIARSAHPREENKQEKDGSSKPYEATSSAVLMETEVLEEELAVTSNNREGSEKRGSVEDEINDEQFALALTGV